MSPDDAKTVKAEPANQEQALTLSVVLPLRNDADRVLNGLDWLFALFRGLEWELVLIDLGSMDGTFEIVEPFESYANVKLIAEEEERALGFGHKLGSLVAAGQAILLADLDRPLEPRRFRDDLQMLKDECSMLLYTPLHPDVAGSRPMSQRMMARRLRKLLHAPAGERPTDPGTSVVMLTRDLSMQLFMPYVGADRTATYELIQMALLRPKPSFREIAVSDAWPGKGWLGMGSIVREAKRVTRRLAGR